jgi:hypothetical protein
MPAYCRHLKLADEHVTMVELAIEQCRCALGGDWVAEILGYLLPPGHVYAREPGEIPPYPTASELNRLDGNEEECCEF